MSRVVRISCLYLPFILLCLVPFLSAQSDRGTITGTIKDSSGAVIPGARVTVTNVATNVPFRTVAGSTGDFTAPSLPVGVYQVRIEFEGFKAYLRSNIQVAAGSTIRVDAVLELGEKSETVEVSADLQMLQTDTGKVASQVTNRMIEELPLVVGGGVRTPFDLAGITADVKTIGSSMAIAGGQVTTWGISLDGVSAATGRALYTSEVQVNTPSVEALTEFSVESGGFKAEFGRGTGGSINFVSKSGTNQLHGSAYEFLRNDALDARGFFEPQKRIYKQNNFGVTVGGPVWLPKLYDGRDKTFFFFSYEGFRNRVGAEATALSVPPPEFYNGDFRNLVDASGKMIQLYDPATTRQVNGVWVRDKFENNQIPVDRFDPLAKAIMQFGASVKPNRPNLVPGTRAYITNNFLPSGTRLDPANKTSVKIDHNLNQNNRLALFLLFNRGSFESGPTGAPGLPYPLSGFQEGERRSNVYRGSWDFTISSSWMNRFYVGVNNWFTNQKIPAANGGWENKTCVNNVPDCDYAFPQIVFTDGSFTTWAGLADNGSESNVVGFNDDMTKVYGPHTFKFGYQYERNEYVGTGKDALSGNLQFSPLSTSVPLNSNIATGGGNGFASFLLGQAWWGRITTPRAVSTQWRYHGMYFQDDWRVTRRLTLNLGIRYEITLAPTNPTRDFSEWDTTRPNPGAGNIPGALIFAGEGTGREGKSTLVPSWKGGIGPRVGFAFGLTEKTVIRGSASRTFGAIRNTSGSTHFLGFIQTADFANTSQGLTPTYVLSEGMPPWLRPPFIDPSFGNGNNVPWWQGVEATKMPEMYSFNLSIQQQLTPNNIVEIGYVGTMGAHLQANLIAANQLDYRSLPASLSPFTAQGRALLSSNINSAAAQAAGIQKPYPSFNGTVAQSLRPFPQILNLDTARGGGDHSGHSTYHSMSARFERRMSAGLTFQAYYLLSKLMTDCDSIANLNTISMDQFDRSLEKSIGQYDQTHNLKLNYLWELPFGPGRRFVTNGWGAWLIGGWRLSGIMTYSSGTPVPLGTSVSFPIFNGSNRPTITTYEGWRAPTKGESFDPNVDRFLQPASFFGPQPSDRFGNMTRYNPKLRYFPNFTENLSIARRFDFGERVRMDFRWEMFNIFNRAHFGPSSGATTLQSSAFGLWQAQDNEPRRMQVALKLYW